MVQQSREQQHTIAFLRLTAVELRKLADRAPEIAAELRHTARQLSREADDLDTPKTE